MAASEARKGDVVFEHFHAERKELGLIRHQVAPDNQRRAGQHLPAAVHIPVHGLQAPPGSRLAIVILAQSLRSHAAIQRTVPKVFGVSLERGPRQFQMIGHPSVIAVHEGHPASPSLAYAAIAGGTGSGILLPDHAQAGVALPTQNLRRFIGRTVIDDNDFKIGLRLAIQTLESRLNIGRHLVNGHHHAEKRLLHLKKLISRISPLQWPRRSAAVPRRYGRSRSSHVA